MSTDPPAEGSRRTARARAPRDMGPEMLPIEQMLGRKAPVKKSTPMETAEARGAEQHPIAARAQEIKREGDEDGDGSAVNPGEGSSDAAGVKAELDDVAQLQGEEDWRSSKKRRLTSSPRKNPSSSLAQEPLTPSKKGKGKQPMLLSPRSTEGSISGRRAEGSRNGPAGGYHHHQRFKSEHDYGSPLPNPDPRMMPMGSRFAQGGPGPSTTASSSSSIPRPFNLFSNNQASASTSRAASISSASDCLGAGVQFGGGGGGGADGGEAGEVEQVDRAGAGIGGDTAGADATGEAARIEISPLAGARVRHAIVRKDFLQAFQQPLPQPHVLQLPNNPNQPLLPPLPILPLDTFNSRQNHGNPAPDRNEEQHIAENDGRALRLDLAEGDIIFLNHATGFQTLSHKPQLSGYYAVVRQTAKNEVGGVYLLQACNRSVLSLGDLGMTGYNPSVYLEDGRVLGRLGRDKTTVEVFELAVEKEMVTLKLETTLPAAIPKLKAEFDSNVKRQTPNNNDSSSLGRP